MRILIFCHLNSHYSACERYFLGSVLCNENRKHFKIIKMLGSQANICLYWGVTLISFAILFYVKLFLQKILKWMNSRWEAWFLFPASYLSIACLNWTTATGDRPEVCVTSQEMFFHLSQVQAILNLQLQLNCKDWGLKGFFLILFCFVIYYTDMKEKLGSEQRSWEIFSAKCIRHLIELAAWKYKGL